MSRTIIHLNVANFAVAVESLADRRLRDRPVAIAPPGGRRTVVYDMSEAAYQCGVRKNMRIDRAIRKCPDLQVLPPHFARYEQAMAALVRQAMPLSPLVESGAGDGHLFVDVTGTRRLHGPPQDVAWRLYKQSRQAVGLTPIWSVATNKLVAKVASRMVKPTGEYVVPAGQETSFLNPLPLALLPCFKPKERMQLKALNLRAVGELSAMSCAQLQIPFGHRARQIYLALRGIDTTPVQPQPLDAARMRTDHLFGQDTNDEPVVLATLYRLVEEIGRRLRRQRLAAGRLSVVLQYADGRRRVYQAAARPPASDDAAIFAVARVALQRAWTRLVRIRHLQLICPHLVPIPAQQPLFAADRRNADHRTALTETIDRIRQQFGPQILQMGRTLQAV